MGRFRERAFWERVVADVDGGMSQAAAARRHGVSQSGLGYWVRRLRAEPRLLPVLVTGSAAIPASRRCNLVVDELRFEFEEGTDPGYVAAVTRALRAC